MDGNLIHRCSFIAHIPVVKFHPKQTKTFQSHCICHCIKHCCSKIKSKKIPSKIQTSSIKMLIFPWLINFKNKIFSLLGRILTNENHLLKKILNIMPQLGAVYCRSQPLKHACSKFVVNIRYIGDLHATGPSFLHFACCYLSA